MITIRNWVATIPEEDKHIGYLGEDGAEYRKFLVSDWQGYRNWVFYLDMAFDLTSVTERDSRQVVDTQENVTETVEETQGKTAKEDATETAAETQVKTAKTGKKETYTKETVTVNAPAKTDVAYLSRKETEEGLVLTWKVLAQQTQLPGKLYANLRAEGPFGEVKKSARMVFEVDPAVVAEPAAPIPQSTFEVMKEDMNELCRIGYEQAAQTAENAESAANAAATATEAAGQAQAHRQVCEEAVLGVQQSVTEARYAAEDAEAAAATASAAAGQAQIASEAAANDAAMAQENRVIAANAAAKVLYLKDVAACYEYGKNLYDAQNAYIGYKLMFGELKESAEHITTDYIPHIQVGGACTYMVSAANGEDNELYTVAMYDAALNFLSMRSTCKIGEVLTFDDAEAPYHQCAFLRFHFRRTLTDLQIEMGDTVTTYETYQSPMVKRDCIPVDGKLDTASDNPVANSVVAVAFAETNRRVADLEQNGGGELDNRVTTVENTLFGVTIEPEPEPVETVTVTNLLLNPLFADGTTGWDTAGATGINLSVTDGVLCAEQVEPSTKLQNLRLAVRNIRTSFIAGNQYFVSAKVKYEGHLPNDLRAQNKGIFDFTVTSTRVYNDSTYPVLGEWCYVSTLLDSVTPPSSGSWYLALQNVFTPALTELVGDKCYVDNIMCIDLTAVFGAGNEPDLATMERWVQEQFTDGFEGTATLALTQEDDGEDDGGEVETTPGLVDKVATLETDVADLAEAMENLPSEVQQTGTIYPTLHDYYIANIEAEKSDYYDKQDANTLTFAMMADMHLKADDAHILKNVEASSAWAKLVNHDFVMMAGDFIIGDEDKATSLGYIDALMEMAEKHANSPVYAVKGNHDTCEQTGNAADRISEKEFYLHAHARGEKYGMVTDLAHPYGGYYYVDFPRQKIRMVCLNTTEARDESLIGVSGNYNFRWGGVFSRNQLEWIVNTALVVPEGWAVMMISHIPPVQGSDVGVTDESSATAQTAAPFHTRGIRNRALLPICDAFVKGEQGSVIVNENGNITISYDFTGQGAREFIGHFCGHVHEDSLSQATDGTTDGVPLNYIVVNSTTPQKRWTTSLDRTADADKLSLNSFIIDRATRTVECIKIGAAPSEYNAWWADSFTW